MGIRTTVTLDEDVVERVREESRHRAASFRDTLNDLLRLALNTSATSAPRPPFKIRAVAMGFRSGLNYDDIEGLLEFGEGETHR
jgi:hypothetical protein